MLTIARLFGKSPFAPLKNHMEKVGMCIAQLPPLVQAILNGDLPLIEECANHISWLEREADLTKSDICNHLPKSLFLPIDRESLLEILSLQDQIARQVESIAHLAAMRSIIFSQDLREEFSLLCQNNLEAFRLVRDVIKELDELLESSFGGIEAEKVKGMVEQISFLNRENDLQQRRILKILYQRDDLLSPLFYLTSKLIEKISWISCLSEKLGNRVCMLLELK
ncbi:MAG TPA: TIGR00153 family protein [Chlamydiales bacterium]|jgi:hypothetical protein|nr:TIGR00153 family protein [Chlamydiales bacterium]